MELLALRLRFTTPLHLGRGSEELDRSETVYHSDSLRAALFAVGLPYFPNWGEQPNTFFNTFRLSSCFPFAGEELFLPKPALPTRFQFSQTEEGKAAKKGKKLEFLSVPVFEQYVNAGTTEPVIDGNCITPDGRFVCAGKETAKKTFFRSEVQQRVTVFHEGNDESTRPFYADRLFFEPDCGLYCWATFENSTIRQQILQTLRLLGEMGIGTDRTVGNGLFDFSADSDVSEHTLHVGGLHNRQLSLGLYWPNQQEFGSIDLSQSYWQLIKRGGYMGGTSESAFLSLRKKSVYMFTEGSTFLAPKPLQGRFDDLKPDWDAPMHPVWRDGQCLFLTI